VIFDPAVYGGHREIDLAMLALFGGLGETLIDAYHEVWPLGAGWRSRLGLWQLYPLAVHAVLFGGSYLAQLARGLDAAAG
jgi:fructosamine-3-kinase